LSKVCLVIPVYNENRTLHRTIVELMEGSRDYKLLFVDDGSNDGSTKTLTRLHSKYQFDTVTHDQNLGYGSACRSGADWAISKGYEWIVFADSDLTNPLNEIVDLVKRIQNVDFDVYKANRVASSTSMSFNSSYRKFLSLLAKRFTKFFVGPSIKDPTNGFRAIRSDFYKQFRLHSCDFSLIMEEVYEYIRLEARICNFEARLGTRSLEQKESSFRYNKQLIQRYVYWCFRCLLRRIFRLFTLLKARLS